MQAEQFSGLIIAGPRPTPSIWTTERTRLKPARRPWMIWTRVRDPVLVDDRRRRRREMESSIVQNQDKMTYWTNFDSWIDYVTLLFWVAALP